MLLIHVNRNTLASNKKRGENEPAVTVRTGSAVLARGHVVDVLGRSRVVQDEEHPLACGARVWIETMGPVVVDGVESWALVDGRRASRLVIAEPERP